MRKTRTLLAIAGALSVHLAACDRVEQTAPLVRPQYDYCSMLSPADCEAMSTAIAHLMRNPGLSMCYQAGLTAQWLLDFGDQTEYMGYHSEAAYDNGKTYRNKIEYSTGTVTYQYLNTDIKHSIMNRPPGQVDSGAEITAHEMFHRMGYGWESQTDHDDVYAMAANCR